MSIKRSISKGCPQGSCSGPGFWNIFYNPLLTLKYTRNTKVIAFADDLLLAVKGRSNLELENYANLELQKITNWAKENKIKFNDQKSKMLIITRRKPQIQREINIYLNNRKLNQEETIKYLGIIIDRKFSFNQHIEHVTQKSTKLIHALSRSARVTWGLNSDVMRIIYKGAILPLLSYGAPVWEEAIRKRFNIVKLQRVQRLINLKIAKAYRTTSSDALCILTKNQPILIELQQMVKISRIKKEQNWEEKIVDAITPYTLWPHPAEVVEIKEKQDGWNYKVSIYTDGSKGDSGVGSGIAIYLDHVITYQLQYRLHEKCSNNQAEQFAILKALEHLESLQEIQSTQKNAAIHTDSRITLESLRNSNNHLHLIERIRQQIRKLEQLSWSLHFTWVKAHVGNEGNELADCLAKQAASNDELPVSYSRIPASVILQELRVESSSNWESEWIQSKKGAVTKSFFPSVKVRLKLNIPLNTNTTTFLTGHGKLGSYYYRFKIKDNPSCSCGAEVQTVDHVLFECSKLETERAKFISDMLSKKGKWTFTKTKLMLEHTKSFIDFLNAINLETI